MDYIANFTQLYQQDAWFGDAYMEKLADVTEKEAFTPPVQGIHTIAELVSHVIYWRSVIITGIYPSMDSPENWPSLDTLKAKGWTNLLKDFAESQNKLIAVLKNAKPEYFKEEYKPGRTMDYLVEGIMQHDIYHLGQLALVKKMIRN
jgi:uncharacterized damage-inducible protein DinB